MSSTKAVLILFSLAAFLYSGNAIADEAAPKKIKAKAYLEYDKLPAGKKCGVVMEIQVKEGWHINAAEPETKVSTSFTVKTKNGTKLTDVKYPKAHAMNIPDLGEIVAYDGKILIRGTLEAPADAAGKAEELVLQIRYQACNDVSCEPPKTFKVKGKIKIVPEGTSLKKTNVAFFKKSK